jgi:hypothetical protein
MPIELVKKAIKKAREELAGEKADKCDMKSRARTLKGVIRELASEANVNLNGE